MGSPGSHCDNTPGTKWTTTKVSDCKVVGLWATVKKEPGRVSGPAPRRCQQGGQAFKRHQEQKGSPDWHHKNVSKLDVPSRGVMSMKVSGPGPRAPAIRSCASEGRLERRLFQHGSLTLRVTAGGEELCLKSGIEDPPWRQHDETIAGIA